MLTLHVARPRTATCWSQAPWVVVVLAGLHAPGWHLRPCSRACRGSALRPRAGPVFSPRPSPAPDVLRGRAFRTRAPRSL